MKNKTKNTENQVTAQDFKNAKFENGNKSIYLHNKYYEGVFLVEYNKEDLHKNHFYKRFSAIWINKNGIIKNRWSNSESTIKTFFEKYDDLKVSSFSGWK